MPNVKKLSTDTLDDAMKELLDLCAQYKDEIDQKQGPISKSTSNDHARGHFDRLISKDEEQFRLIETECDTLTTTNDKNTKMEGPTYDHNGVSFNLKDDDGNETIKRLQERQSELQFQLDEALMIARNLELKQNKQLNNLIDDNKCENKSSCINALKNAGRDEDVELIEFQQIENELNLSELNRQMNNLQEELRLRLYKRLQSKTYTSNSRTSKDGHLKQQQQQQIHGASNKESLRRSSTQTDDATPSSSSCSDDPTVTFSSNNDMAQPSYKNGTDVESTNHFDKCHISNPPAVSNSIQRVQSSSYQTNAGSTLQNASSIGETLNNIIENQKLEKLDLNRPEDANDFQAVLPTLSNSSNDHPNRKASRIPTFNNVHTTNFSQCLVDAEPFSKNNIRQLALNGFEMCPATTDLERIDEDEEDEVDYYCNSERYRSIYEQKISPIFQANDIKSSYALGKQNHSIATHNSRTVQQIGTHSQNQIKSDDKQNLSTFASPKPSNDRRFNLENVNSAKRGNRPLTIYLPKPDEDIDLIETIQALGHDLDILSADIKMTSKSAGGFLYKSRSKNAKKWLKRYFYFDRELKVLSYYENEEQLVKKTNSPKCTIAFDEISDVYVEHRLSELSEKHRGIAHKIFVFVLVTIKRRYLLASSKAEVMRAWIDILFTAAKANDLFQQMENNEESQSFEFNSFTES